MDVFFNFGKIVLWNPKLFIQVDSKNNADAILAFASQFSDATIETQTLNEDTHYLTTYGMNKAAFESSINIGIAQSILGMTKPWIEVKKEFLEKISGK